MVSIGNNNWSIYSSDGKIKPADSGVVFTGTRVNPNGNTLQDRLSAIDKGEPTALLSVRGSANVSGGGVVRPQGETLLERLDAIGTGELSPKYGEKNFDLNM